MSIGSRLAIGSLHDRNIAGDLARSKINCFGYGVLPMARKTRPGRSNERCVGIAATRLYCYSEVLVRPAHPTTAEKVQIRRCSTPGPDPGPLSSASACPRQEQTTPSRPWSEAEFPSCAPGNAGRFTFSGFRITSSRKGAWIVTISIDCDPSSEKNERRLTAPKTDYRADRVVSCCPRLSLSIALHSILTGSPKMLKSLAIP